MVQLSNSFSDSYHENFIMALTPGNFVVVVMVVENDFEILVGAAVEPGKARDF